jgi:predicted TIM-barrel fold metal-dependent hydrolase
LSNAHITVNPLNSLILSLLILTSNTFGESHTAHNHAPSSVYLFIGETDQAGLRDEVMNTLSLLERCYVLGDDGKWMTPSPSSTNSVQGTSPITEFVQAELKANPDESIGIICSTSQAPWGDQWSYKGRYYRDARRQAKLAVKTSTLQGVIWIHAHGTTHMDSLDQLKDLMAYLRVDTRLLDLPFLHALITENAPLESQLRALISTVHATSLITPDALSDSPGTAISEAMRALQHNVAEKEKSPTSNPNYFDVHIHAFANKEGGLEPLIAWMNRNKVHHCIVSPLDASRATTDEQRRIMLKNYEKYGDRIKRFCLINPEEVSTMDEALAILEKEKTAGAVGMGEHYGRNMMFDDPANMRLYAACEKAGLPVLFHIDQNKNMDEAGLPRVERVLKTFPNCILIAHAYWWLHLPDGTCDRLLQTYPNLYADFSGLRVAAMLNRDREYTREFLTRHAGQILFGSDAGWWSFSEDKERELQFDLLEAIDLPDDVRNKIYRENARRLFLNQK